MIQSIGIRQIIPEALYEYIAETFAFFSFVGNHFKILNLLYVVYLGFYTKQSKHSQHSNVVDWGYYKVFYVSGGL